MKKNFKIKFTIYPLVNVQIMNIKSWIAISSVRIGNKRMFFTFPFYYFHIQIVDEKISDEVLTDLWNRKKNIKN